MSTQPLPQAAATPATPAPIKVNLPNVPVEAVEGFSKVWKTPGGLSIMLDSATKQFALDFARVTLRSFIIANTQAAQKAVAAARAPAKSSIVLTDV